MLASDQERDQSCSGAKILIEKYWGLFRSNFHCDSRFFVAQFLVLAIVVAMTRAFALVVLFEVILWILFVAYGPLRREFVSALNDPRVYMIMIFWLWVAVAGFWGVAEIGERIDEWWSWRKLLLVPFCFVLFRGTSVKRVLMLTLIAACTPYMIFSWLGSVDLVTLDRQPRHLLENHSTQGIMFATAAFFACMILLESDLRWHHRLILAFLILGFVSNILIVLTGNSSYLALVAGVVVLAHRAFARNLFWVGAAGLLSLALLFVFETPRTQILKAYGDVVEAKNLDAEVSSLGIRVVMWENTVKMIKDRPLFGTGSGSFKYGYAEQVRDIEGWRGGPSDNPHQQYLQIAAEQGLIGLTLFIWALVVWLIPLKWSSISSYQYCGLAVLLGCFLNSFFNGHFSSFVEGRLVWISLAVLLVNTYDFNRPINARRGG